MILDEPAHFRTSKLPGRARQDSGSGINARIEPEGCIVGEVEQTCKDEGRARTVAEIAVFMQTAHIHSCLHVVITHVDGHDIGPLECLVTEKLRHSEEGSERRPVADGSRAVPQFVGYFRITAGNEIRAPVEIAKPSLVDQIRIKTSRPRRQ